MEEKTYRVSVFMQFDVQATSTEHAIERASELELPDSYVTDSFDVTDVRERDNH